MFILCNRINNGHIGNLNKINIPFKHKYIPILKRLCDLNYIDNFIINKNHIDIILRYYNNKPLIYLEPLMLNSYKQYHKAKYIKRNKLTVNPILYTSDKGIYYKDEINLLSLGGKPLIKIHLLYKNIVF
jgi:ribosomal protein S8